MSPENIFGLLFYTISPTLTSILLFLIGILVLKPFRIPIPAHTAGFFALFVGFLFTNVLTSLLLTRGVTNQWLIVMLAIFFIFVLKYQKQAFRSDIDCTIPILPNLKLVVLLNLIWGTIYTIAFYLHIADSEVVRAFYPDNYFYSLTGEYILETGQENHYGNVNTFSGFKGGTCPYHYFMIYQNVIHGHLWQLNAIWSYIVSVPILFASLASLLIISIIKDTNIIKNQYIILSTGILALYFSGFNIIPIKYPEQGNFTLQLVNHVAPKYLPLFICMALASWTLYKEKYLWVVYPMLLMSFFSFMMLPVTLWTVIIGLFFAFIFKKINRQELIVHTAINLSFLLVLVLFYAFTTVADEADPLAVSYSEVIKSFFANPFIVIKRVIGTHFYYVVEYIIYFVPIFILLLINRKNVFSNKDLASFLPIAAYLVIMFEGATLATWMLHGHGEGFQVMFFTVTIGSTLLLFWLVLFSWKTQIKYFQLVTAIIFSVSLWNMQKHFTKNYSYRDSRFEYDNVSKQFYKDCSSLLNNKQRHDIALIGSVGIAELYSTMRVLYQMNSNIRLYCIEEKNKKQLSAYEQYWHNIFYFNQYIKNKDQSDLIKLQKNFIKEKNIQYLIVDKFSKEDDYWIKNSTLLYKDGKTGLALYKITK